MSHHHYLSLGVLLILSAYFAISVSKPTTFNTEESMVEAEARPLSWEVDQARKMWNEAKEAYKKMQRNFNKLAVSRTKRSHTLNGSSFVYPEIANITGGRYMIDLFRNLTNATEHSRTDTQANTIKSLTFTKIYPIARCDGEFNFTLAALNSSEFILKSKLRLYLQLIHPVSTTYFMDIKIKYSNGLLSEMSVMKEIVPSEDGYTEFEVAELVRALNTGETHTHAVFKVFIYKTIQDLERSRPLTCGDELKFVNTDTNETTMPILVIYSYNSRVENIDYLKVAERVRLQSALQPDENTDPNATQGRRKRFSGDIGDCGVKTLNVMGSEIVPDLLGLDSSLSALAPASYNAGICGGRCVSNLPGGIASKHAPFVHVLLNIQGFKNRHGFAFDQCCVPVKYKPLDVLFLAEGTRLTISIIPDMIIETCECIDIAV